MNKKLLELFQLKVNNPQLTQRSLAAKLDISLGKTNSLLEKLKNNNLISNDFLLTNQGKQFIKDHQPKRAVILAAGYGMRMVPINTEEPKGLLEVKGTPLIERLIKQLHEKGIEDIQIVVGFMKEHYEYLIDKYDVNLIVNPRYSDWNNIYSLYLARNYLKDSYILPCDLWFVDNPFSSIEDQSWYMFSNNYDQDMEWLVSNRGTVKKVKENGNKMVGIAYLDSLMAKKLKDFLIDRVKFQNSLDQFWESTLIQNGGFILAPYVISDDKYTEINSYEELRDLDDSSNHLKTDAMEVIGQTLNISIKDISNIHILKKGMTNRSFMFKAKGNRYIMRIPGEGTKELINRQQEYDVYQVIRKLPYVERTLYLNPENGYKLTQFIDGARNCNPNDWDEVKQSMKLLKKFHDSGFKVKHSFNLQQQINMYEKLRNGSSAYRDYDEVKERVLELLNYIDSIPNKQITLCHIDANADNFVFDSENNLHLIDWEYAGMQDPHVDIAMFAIYSMYGQEQIDHLIDLYFDGSVDSKMRYKIYAYVAICGLLWSNWCEYKQSLGLDFGEYSLAQYRYAKEYSRKVLEKLKG